MQRCVSFCIRCSCTISQHNKNEEHSKEHSSFLVRCRSRHSVSKGPPDLSPKFFRFAQNLDTRVRVPTTQNNKNSEADKYLLRYFGTLEGTRTPDLLVRSQSLYPAELPAHTNKNISTYSVVNKISTSRPCVS